MGIIDIVILLSSCVIDIYLFYSFFDNFFEKRFVFSDNKRVRIGVNCLVILVLFVGNIFGNGDLNAFWTPIITCIYVWIVFRGKIGNKLLYFMVALLIIFGCEWLFAIILNLDNDAYKNMSEIPFILFALKLLTYILFVIVEQFVGKNKKKMDNWTFLKFLPLPISSLGIMLLVFYSGVNFSVKPQIGTLITCCYALLLFGNILIFYAFNKYSEELYLNMEHQILITKQQADLSYFTKVAEQQEDHNEFIHNTTHYLRIVNKFAQMHDFNSIIEIVGELDNHMVQSEMILYSNHHVLNAILSEQKQKAEENNICFDAYVEPGIVLDMVENIDLIVMLGNLLDNAMRAAKGCKENPYIQVRIYMQEIGGFCVIKVVNNFSNEIKEKEGKILTTKKEEGTHGLGIGSVQKTAEKYGGFLSCKYEDSVFEAVLLLSTDVK